MDNSESFIREHGYPRPIINVSHAWTQESTTSTTASSFSPVLGATSSSLNATPSNKSGHRSYVELITQAIWSSPEKRMTLSEIYDWMVANVPSFKDQRHLHSSSGWKNSVRHNLSLHTRFKRVRRQGMNKPSWWTVDLEEVAKTRSSKRPVRSRPRANTTPATSREIKAQRQQQQGRQSPVQVQAPASSGFGQTDPCNLSQRSRIIRHASPSFPGSVTSACSIGSDVFRDRTTASPVSAVPATTSSSLTSMPSNKSRHPSYVELLTQAICSSPYQRMTLSEIYDWMVANVPQFKDQRHVDNSAGWKNSVRHNLSLHARFKRVQRKGMDKPSWWTVDLEEAKTGPSRPRQSRPRANTTTATSQEIRTQRQQQRQVFGQDQTRASFGFPQPQSDHRPSAPASMSFPGDVTLVSLIGLDVFRMTPATEANPLVQDLREFEDEPLPVFSDNFMDISASEDTPAVQELSQDVKTDPKTIPDETVSPHPPPLPLIYYQRAGVTVTARTADHSIFRFPTNSFMLAPDHTQNFVAVSQSIVSAVIKSESVDSDSQSQRFERQDCTYPKSLPTSTEFEHAGIADVKEEPIDTAGDY